MKKYLVLAGAAALLCIPVLRQLLWQIGWGYGLMALALPLCRFFEKRLSRGLSAALSLGVMGGGVLLLMGLALPLILREARQAASVLPEAWARVEPLLERLPLGDLTPLTQSLARAGASLLQRLTAAAGQAGRLMLSPVLAFYFLRDRTAIARGLCLWIPLGWRARAVRGARGARWELTGFLRGQALISLAVGTLSALGLLLVGAPGWLLLGVLMGALELVPYLGPAMVIALAVLFALPRGLGCAAAALAVLLAVQQLEGSVLSPRLMAEATRLHPALVLLIISLGGMAAGVAGMLLALPLTVAARGMLRGLSV